MTDPSDTPGLLYPVPFVEDPKKNPGSIQFVKKEHINNATVLGPPTQTITLPQILQTMPQGTIIMKMDIQTHECRVLRTPGAFTSGHLLPQPGGLHRLPAGPGLHGQVGVPVNRA